MSGNYEQDQAQLLNAVVQLFHSGLTLGAQLLYKPPPVKVSVSGSSDPGLAQGNGQEGPSVDEMRQDRKRTANQDAQDAKKALQEGNPQEEVFQSIREGKVAQRIAESGGDADKYAHLIVQKAEIDHAVELFPNSQAPTQAKTPKKSL